jgi:hypothetical protein
MNKNTQELTPEQYNEIKTKLQEEKLDNFPSVFQQARNLAKQAWISGIDAAKGKPLLSSAEKAAERMKICESCEFFKKTRCEKCGCYMTAKVHLESATCPINKWGKNLQNMLTPESVEKNMQRTVPAEAQKVQSKLRFSPIDMSSISEEIKKELMDLSEDALKYDGRFSHNKTHYIVRPDQAGNRKLYKLNPEVKPPTSVPVNNVAASPKYISQKGIENKKEFLDMVQNYKKEQKSTIFAFEGVNYYIEYNSTSPDESKVFKVNLQNLYTSFNPVNIASIEEKVKNNNLL